MTPYVPYQSIVRKIWGTSDTILFIFAGAAAEFALNKAVDWLYFTGRLPNDPIGRLFSTVSYARQIVFSSKEAGEKAIDTITSIHAAVEKGRGARIPDWAYRDVLYMLIHYSIAAFELLERKLSAEEKEEIYQVFLRIGQRMHLTQLPLTYNEWLPDRDSHLQHNLVRSHYTDDLFLQYKKNLGAFRFLLLRGAQLRVVPSRVLRLLSFHKFSLFSTIVPIYKLCRYLKLDGPMKQLLLPAAYQKQIKDLDVPPAEKDYYA